MIFRNNCVICNDELIFLYKRENFPMKICPTLDNENDDKYYDLQFSYCIDCGTVQLNKLIEPSILYNKNHNNTNSSPLWNKHNNEFYNFIINKIKPYVSIIEIGGSDGTLLKKFDNKLFKKYTLIDLCDDVELPKVDNVYYELKNCETDILPDGDIIIMSHVFEHLYNPRLFLENVYNNTTISDIYISIPYMEYLLNNNSYSFLSFEHTYYICKDNFEFLAKSCGWDIVEIVQFQNHSLFFKLKRNKIRVCKKSNIDYNKIYNYFLNIENRLKNIKISTPSYCFPGGHFGQLLYYYLDANSKKNIINYVDNDITKQNKRIYGTSKFMISMDHIIESNNFLVLNTPYSEEIIDKILNNFNNANIIKI